MHDMSGGAPFTSCPCGSAFESAAAGLRRKAASSGQVHGLCGGCQRSVERHVQRRFGRHRYGGRLADRVGDFVQDCYVKLHAPGGLATFRPPLEAGARLAAFRGWLWRVVHNHCNVTHEYWGRRLLELEGKGVGESACPLPSVTPEQAFMRDYLLTVLQSSIDVVRRGWEVRGKGERFAVLFAFLSEDGSTYADVAARLGVTVNHAHVLVHELRTDLKRARRAAVRETLDLPPGLDPLEEERRIDQELRELMKTLRRPDPGDATGQPE